MHKMKLNVNDQVYEEFMSHIKDFTQNIDILEDTKIVNDKRVSIGSYTLDEDRNWKYLLSHYGSLDEI